MPVRYKKHTNQKIDRPSKKLQPHIIIKTLNILNKNKILKAAWEKTQATYNCRTIRVTPNFPMRTLKTEGLDRHSTRTGRPQMMRDHTAIPNRTINHNRQRKKTIAENINKFMWIMFTNPEDTRRKL